MSENQETRLVMLSQFMEYYETYDLEELAKRCQEENQVFADVVTVDCFAWQRGCAEQLSVDRAWVYVLPLDHEHAGAPPLICCKKHADAAVKDIGGKSYKLREALAYELQKQRAYATMLHVYKQENRAEFTMADADFEGMKITADLKPKFGQTDSQRLTLYLSRLPTFELAQQAIEALKQEAESQGLDWDSRKKWTAEERAALTTHADYLAKATAFYQMLKFRDEDIEKLLGRIAYVRLNGCPFFVVKCRVFMEPDRRRFDYRYLFCDYMHAMAAVDVMYPEYVDYKRDVENTPPDDIMSLADFRDMIMFPLDRHIKYVESKKTGKSDAGIDMLASLNLRFGKQLAELGAELRPREPRLPGRRRPAAAPEPEELEES